jgi:predicted 3-demethylubiquinone-9 3-methyltransferase (glyoxalase superfamily)
VTTVVPFLMFTGAAEEAMDLYVSVIPDSRIVDIVHWGPGKKGEEGKVMAATLSLAGQTVRCFDSPDVHAFTFTPSFSLFVECASPEEMDRIAEGLLLGGEELMPADDYGFSRRFAWLNDRFGVSWQLNAA